ncbi:MAG TPA: SDR family oxidoreductase [Candidatus Aquabacterium excrementipullorum]|nr:SDR family oxidoreductase [Candidatus Aquabacterium excrementipullorum]
MQNLDSLEGRTAFVTGAGSGLGAAIAGRLVRANARVVLADIVEDKARATAKGLDPGGDRTLALKLDVADEQGVATALQAAQERFGALDILVNNAGTDVTASLDEVSVQDWSRVLDTNLLGPLLLSKAALPALRRSRGHIVNIASTAALRAWPNASAYHASKWGLRGLSQALHTELRSSNIRVSTVIAGGMRTPFLLERFPDLDQSKLQDPAAVAEAVHFLLSLPPESVIAEISVLPREETSWP